MPHSSLPLQENSYESRLLDEISSYETCLEVHNLPPIFHYWSNRYLRPVLRSVGIDEPNAMFRDYLHSLCTGGHREFLSIGSGNCDLEIGIAAFLYSKGITDFVIECLELNGAMLERGKQAAFEAGVPEQLRFTQADFNDWKAPRTYDAAMANQSLHHVLNLELLFDEVSRALTPQGLFLISDIIGRNGHQRWPEALAIVQEFWKRLPPSYRYNLPLERYEPVYENWDCSQEAFEGIRSQDVLPLLLDRFHPHLFVGFGNVIDVFTDRSFGFHFDAAAEWDRHFIDEIQQRDEGEIHAGRLTPTHMIAVFGKTPAANPFCNLDPRKCVRTPDPPADEPAPEETGSAPYEWHSWPHSAETQLEVICGYLEKTRNSFEQHQIDLEKRLACQEEELKERTRWARRLESQQQERTEWAIRLDRELQERTDWATTLDRELNRSAAAVHELQLELAARTAWAQSLDRECAERGERVRQLDQELSIRTAWALRLQQELDEGGAWRQNLEAVLHNPLRFAAQVTRLFRKRIRRMIAARPRN